MRRATLTRKIMAFAFIAVVRALAVNMLADTFRIFKLLARLFSRGFC